MSKKKSCEYLSIQIMSNLDLKDIISQHSFMVYSQYCLIFSNLDFKLPINIYIVTSITLVTLHHLPSFLIKPANSRLSALMVFTYNLTRIAAKIQSVNGECHLSFQPRFEILTCG